MIYTVLALSVTPRRDSSPKGGALGKPVLVVLDA